MKGKVCRSGNSAAKGCEIFSFSVISSCAAKQGQSRSLWTRCLTRLTRLWLLVCCQKAAFSSRWIAYKRSFTIPCRLSIGWPNNLYSVSCVKVQCSLNKQRLYLSTNKLVWPQLSLTSELCTIPHSAEWMDILLLLLHNYKITLIILCSHDSNAGFYFPYAVPVYQCSEKHHSFCVQIQCMFYCTTNHK